MRILVVSCSLNPDSNSFVLAQHVSTELRAAGAEVDFVDLREHALPVCDGETCTNPSVVALTARVEAADAVLLAAPIYNFDVNAAAKNLVEHTGSAWEGKLLMLDFRCLIVPRFVYATGGDFAEGRVTSAKIAGRVAQLASETMRLATALRGAAAIAGNG
jgi:FMN reductase